MSDQIFQRSDALRRELSGPLREARLAYLRHRAEQGAPRSTQGLDCGSPARVNDAATKAVGVHGIGFSENRVGGNHAAIVFVTCAAQIPASVKISRPTVKSPTETDPVLPLHPAKNARLAIPRTANSFINSVLLLFLSSPQHAFARVLVD